MSLQPVVPVPVLIALAVLIIAARLLMLRRLTTAGRTRAAPWRWAGVTFAALLLLGAAARPILGTEDTVTRTAGGANPNVFLLIDRSAGMAVQDAGNGRSRLAAVRADLATVIDRYPDARFAVITFTSRPSVDWPLSADAWSLRPVLAALTPEPATPDAVSAANAAAAANVLRYQLINAVQQYPRARNLVFYFGAGAGGSSSPKREFNLPEGAVSGGTTLGYGSAEGGPIPTLADSPSAIDEPALSTVAGEIGVPYVHRDGTAPLGSVMPEAGPVTGATAAAASPRVETYWVFALGAAVLLLVELYLVLRDFRRTRPTGPAVVA